VRVVVDDHPFEIGLSMALVLFGARALSDFKALPQAVDLLPWWLSLTYCVLSIAGGGMTIVGLFGKYRYAWMSGLEKAGLWVSASAWASYAVGLLLGPFSIRATMLELALAALVWASLMRTRAITRRDTTRRQALEGIREQYEKDRGRLD
jgi:hypothetical protein